MRISRLRISPGNVCAALQTDGSYDELPISATMFWVHATPATDLAVPYPDAPGRTELIDCTAAFRELPQDLKRRLEGLRAWHEDGHGIVDIENMGQLTEVEFYPGRTHEPGVLHELVRTHPHTGEKSLWCPLDTLRSVEGMSEEEALELLVPLKDHLLQPRFRYSHQHQPHDVMVWDTLQTLHKANPIGTATSAETTRFLYRISVKGDPSATLPREDDPAWLEHYIHKNAGKERA